MEKIKGKNKKIMITISVIVVIFLLLLLALMIYLKDQYSLEETIKLLNTRGEQSNKSIEIEQISNDWGKIERDVLQKDNLYHITVKNETDGNVTEHYYNQETSEMIFVNQSQKIIVKLPNTIIETDYSGNATFMSMCSDEDYQYMGKEIINEKECIKVSLTENRSDGNTESFFYIDIENGDVLKIETYERDVNGNTEKKGETLYTYDYDTINKDDKIEFDINNYPNYYYETIVNTDLSN